MVQHFSEGLRVPAHRHKAWLPVRLANDGKPLYPTHATSLKHAAIDDSSCSRRPARLAHSWNDENSRPFIGFGASWNQPASQLWEDVTQEMGFEARDQPGAGNDAFSRADAEQINRILGVERVNLPEVGASEIAPSALDNIDLVTNTVVFFEMPCVMVAIAPVNHVNFEHDSLRCHDP